MKLGPVQTFVHTVDTSTLVKSLTSHLEYLLSSLSTRYFVKMFEMSSKQTLTLHWLLDYWQNSSVKRADWELWPTSHLTADNPHSPLSPTDCWEEERRGASLSHRKLSHLRQRWPVLPSLPTSRSSDASQHHTEDWRRSRHQVDKETPVMMCRDSPVCLSLISRLRDWSVDSWVDRTVLCTCSHSQSPITRHLLHCWFL